MLTAALTWLAILWAVYSLRTVLDHFALVGFEQHPAGLWRIAGCVLMVGGLALVSAF